MPTVQGAPPGQLVNGVRFHPLPAELDTGPGARARVADLSVEAQEAAITIEKLVGVLGVHVIACRDDPELERIQSLLVDKSFELQNNKGLKKHVWYMDRDTRRLKTDKRLRIADFDHGEDTEALQTRLEMFARGTTVVRTTLGPTLLGSAQFRVAAANPIKNHHIVVFIPFDELSESGWLPKEWIEYASRDGTGDGYEKWRKSMNGDE